MNHDDQKVPPIIPRPSAGPSGRTGLLLSLVAPAALVLMLGAKPG